MQPTQMLFAALFHVHCLVNFASSFANEGYWKVSIEHSWSGRTNFKLRGHVRLSQSLPGAKVYGEFVPSGTLNQDELNELRSAADRDLPYLVRAPNSFEAAAGHHGDDEKFVMSYTDPCRLLAADFQEVLTLSVDSANQRILSIVTQQYLWNYQRSAVEKCTVVSSFGDEATFNTTVRVIDVEEGPSPDTQSYLQKIDKEAEKQKGNQQDNRSFLAKYWMYIVPVVIFLMVSSAMNQEGQEGGGARYPLPNCWHDHEKEEN